MFPDLANSAQLFGSIFFATALILMCAAVIAAARDKPTAASLARGFFINCIVVAMLLWIFAWLMS